MTAAQQPAGTVTFVFTDIEGSTRLLEQLGPDRYRDALAEHRRIVRDAFVKHDGYEVGTEGDSFFIAFHTAQAAVAAVEDATAGLDHGPIRIRVGIHTGQPTLDPPNYVGIDVHRAARIMSAAHGGQVLVSASTASLLGRKGLTDLGEHTLKDLEAPEHLYQLGAARFPPPGSLTTTRARERTRRRKLVAVATLAAGAAIVALVVSFTRSDEPTTLAGVDAGSVGVIDPESGRIVAQVAMGASPRRLAYGDTGVWSTNGDDETVSLIDPETQSLAKTFRVDGFAVDVGIRGSREAWVVTTPGLHVMLVRVDPEFGIQEQPIPTGLSAAAGVDIFGERSNRIAVGDEGAWVTSAGTASTAASAVSSGGGVLRVSDSGALGDVVPLGRAKEVLVTGTSLWVAELGAVTHFDLEAGTSDRISLGSTAVPNGIAVGADAVWVATGPITRISGSAVRTIGSSALTRIDPGTDVVVATMPIDGTPRGVAVTDDGVWVTDRTNHRVLRIDPSTNRVAGTIELGSAPDDIVSGGGRLWVAVP